MFMDQCIQLFIMGYNGVAGGLKGWWLVQAVLAAAFWAR